MQAEISGVPAVVDWILHSGETVTFVVTAFLVIRRLNRDESLKKDYPPHRHVEGRIMYAPDYPPAAIERLSTEK